MGLPRRISTSRHALVAGLLLLAVGLLGCDQGSQTTSSPPDTTKGSADSKAPANEVRTEVEKTPTSARPDETPVATAEDVHLIVRYVRPAVEPRQYYVQVEQVVAGPNVCDEESLLLELQNTDVAALQWEPQDRLDVVGAYHEEAGRCRVVLNGPTHTVKTLPKPEPASPPSPPKPTPAAPTETSTPSAAQTVRLLGTLSGVRDDSAFFIVDRVIEGPFDCVQATVVGANLELVEQAQYQIEGSYEADEGNCQLRLVDPLNGLIMSALPPAVVAPKPPVGVAPEGTGGTPFFVSAGVSYLDPLPIFSGSAGLGFTPRLRGMVTAGLGNTTVEMALPSGEPIDVDVGVVLVKLSGLLSVQGPFYAGLSGGLLLLSGTYDLPYPVDGSTAFKTSIPLLGVVVGYDLGAFMVTLGAEIALGGKR